MPEIKYYTVKQTRMVRVRANNAMDATLIAKVAFEKGQDANGLIDPAMLPFPIYGNTTSGVQETGLDTELER